MRNYIVNLDVTYTGRVEAAAHDEAEAKKIAHARAKRGDLNDCDFLDAHATQVLFDPPRKQ